jgi:hypothetical protein
MSAAPHTSILHPECMQISKFSEISKEEILSLSCSQADSSVIVNDVKVEFIGEGGKELSNIMTISTKLMGSVMKTEEGGLKKCIPHDDPVAMCFHSFCRCGSAKSKFYVAQLLCMVHIM